MARDWRSSSFIEAFFQKYYFAHIPGTKNDGEFESGMKNEKRLYFWSFEGQNQKMNSKFSVFSVLAL